MIDVVDEDWARDTLPNDSVPLPEGTLPPEDTEDAVGVDAATKRGKPAKDKWMELAIQPH